MRAFYLSCFQFFCCFLSSFAAPPLLPVIRDNIGLTATHISYAAIASVTGAVFARLLMGPACDLFGPRLASATLTAPAVYCTSIANSAASFILIRFFTGFSLATFVSNQYWMSSMFSPPVLGTANAYSAGWGNLGAGLTQLLMPLLHDLIRRTGAPSFTAWRIAFFIPGLIQTLSAFLVMLLGQDLPDGDFQDLQARGHRRKDEFSRIVRHGFLNYRGWITALCYGFSFGVELTVDNIIAQYFYDRFNLDLRTAGMIAASFGLTNFFARPGGGFISDLLGKGFGMRGRLWGWWIIQTTGGVLCIILGMVGSLSASIAVMLVFSVFIQSSCGLAFGVVPFISRRSLGVISGMTGAGGNAGAVLTQLILFRGSRYSTEVGIVYMGIMIVACTLPMGLLYFPQWGGMLCGPKPGYREEDYYGAEWNGLEQERGFHESSIRFAVNSRGERSRRSDSVTFPVADRTPSCLRAASQ